MDFRIPLDPTKIMEVRALMYVKHKGFIHILSDILFILKVVHCKHLNLINPSTGCFSVDQMKSHIYLVADHVFL